MSKTELAIIYKGDDYIVVDKPAGMLVHADGREDSQGNKTSEKTVADILEDLIDDPESDRPGIIHRLDRDTSGLLLVARSTKAREYFQDQFKQRLVEKYYLAAVRGKLKLPQARLEWPITRSPKDPTRRQVRSGGKMAITEYSVLEEKDDKSLLRVKILTGRTHQIRVHLAHLGHPVLGDSVYGVPEKGLTRQFLHATDISFKDMIGKEVSYSSELASDLNSYWDSHLSQL
ncbi:MAG: RNA pseudouridine synthase [Candidatus Saccharimonadales bacterium]